MFRSQKEKAKPACFTGVGAVRISWGGEASSGVGARRAEYFLVIQPHSIGYLDPVTFFRHSCSFLVLPPTVWKA